MTTPKPSSGGDPYDALFPASGAVQESSAPTAKSGPRRRAPRAQAPSPGADAPLATPPAPKEPAAPATASPTPGPERESPLPDTTGATPTPFVRVVAPERKRLLNYSFTADPAQMADLEVLGREMQVPRSDLIRQAIAFFLQHVDRGTARGN